MAEQNMVDAFMAFVDYKKRAHSGTSRRNCSARFELANGETVSPCHLAPDHNGPHAGTCLGSVCTWPQGVTSERELHEPNAAHDGRLGGTS